MKDENTSTGNATTAMSAAKANAEVTLIEAQTNKVKVDMALLIEQMEKLKRENRKSQQREQTLSGRYWFVPSATHLFQPIGAGLILAGAFFFLYQPVVDAVRIVTEADSKVATAESKLASLEAKIQGSENKILSETLAKREALIKEQDARFNKELEKLVEDLKTNQNEKNDAITLLAQLKTDQKRLVGEYESFKSHNKTETAKYQSLAEKAQSRVDALERQLSMLEFQANIARAETDHIEEQLKLSRIRG